MVLKTIWYVDEEDAVETGEIAVFVGEQLRRDGAARRGRRARCHPARARAAHRGARPRSVRRAVLRLRPGRRRLRGGGGGARDRRRRDRAVGLLRQPQQRLAAHLHPQAGGGGVPACGRAAARAADAVRAVPGRAGCRRRRARSSATSPTTRSASTSRSRTSTSLLSSAHDAHMAQISVQQNDDMRKISAWVAIAAVPTMIAGIYGMNFEHMPELGWTYGYPAVVAVMAGHLRRPVPPLQEVRLAVAASCRSGGRDRAGGQETDQDRAERHPVGDEPGDRVVGHELAAATPPRRTRR